MLTIHLTILGITALVIVVTDTLGFLWVLGIKKYLPRNVLHWSHILVWVGLIGMIITGTIMAWPIKEFLVTQALFNVKMFFVGLLVINAYLIGKHMKHASTQTFKELSTKIKTQMVVSGLISTGSWIGAFVMAKIFF